MPHTIFGTADRQRPHRVAARTWAATHWTLSLHFTLFETVDPELMIVHPMGILITYVRGDRALVTG